MPGAGLSHRRPRKAPLGKPAFQPYWGKPAVRNDRGDRGDVGIIRSPVRASILPDCGGRPVMDVPNAICRGCCLDYWAPPRHLSAHEIEADIRPSLNETRLPAT